MAMIATTITYITATTVDVLRTLNRRIRYMVPSVRARLRVRVEYGESTFRPAR